MLEGRKIVAGGERARICNMQGHSAVPKAVRVPLVRRNSRSGGSSAPVSPESRRLLRTQGFVHPGKLAEIEEEFRMCQVCLMKAACDVV